MAAHYDAAGGGLDRFQPIVTPMNHPGTHYDSRVGISLSQGDKEGFADRFWGRVVDSLHPSGSVQPRKLILRTVLTFAGLSRHQPAFLHESHSSIRSPRCPRFKLPRTEAHFEKEDGPSHIPAIDGVYSSCCCPDIQMPSGKAAAGPRFLRRHSSLWENLDPLSSALDLETDKDLPVPFEAKNMPEGGEPINPVERHTGGEDEDLHVAKANWAHRTRAGSEALMSRSSIHEDF